MALIAVKQRQFSICEVILRRVLVWNRFPSDFKGLWCPVPKSQSSQNNIFTQEAWGFQILTEQALHSSWWVGWYMWLPQGDQSLLTFFLKLFSSDYVLPAPQKEHTGFLPVWHQTQDPSDGLCLMCCGEIVFKLGWALSMLLNLPFQKGELGVSEMPLAITVTESTCGSCGAPEFSFWHPCQAAQPPVILAPGRAGALGPCGHLPFASYSHN